MADAGSSNNMLTVRTTFGNGNIETGGNNGYVSGEQRTSPVEALEKVAEKRNTDEHAVDIKRWADSLAEILDDVPRHMCIAGHLGRVGRIPENLREVDIEAYEPYFLSIGPYHHGKPRLEHMEKRKHLVLKHVLERKPELALKHYLKHIKSIEPIVRAFYSDIEMETEEFVRMLLLDSLYIVTVFCGMPTSTRINWKNSRTGGEDANLKTSQGANQINEGNQRGNDTENTQMVVKASFQLGSETCCGENNADPPRWFWTLLAHDLFLIENQVPFFVLQEIHNLTYGGSEAELLRVMKYEVSNMLIDYTKLDPRTAVLPNEEAHHLLHLCHMFFRPTNLQESSAYQFLESNQMYRLGNAVQLYEAGVCFQARSATTQHCLIDITFESSGTLVMPCLSMDDNTISLLRNLIALEQMKYPRMGLNVSAYAVLLLHLVTTSDDVELLRRKGIIQHHLASDKEMVYIINRLSVGLAFDYVEDTYHLKPVFQELKRYSERRQPKWRAGLKHKYFKNPWTTISLLAASLLLILTIVETFYTVYSYYYPYFSQE